MGEPASPRLPSETLPRPSLSLEDFFHYFPQPPNSGASHRPCYPWCSVSTLAQTLQHQDRSLAKQSQHPSVHLKFCTSAAVNVYAKNLEHSFLKPEVSGVACVGDDCSVQTLAGIRVP